MSLLITNTLLSFLEMVLCLDFLAILRILFFSLLEKSRMFLKCLVVQITKYLQVQVQGTWRFSRFSPLGAYNKVPFF